MWLGLPVLEIPSACRLTGICPVVAYPAPRAYGSFLVFSARTRLMKKGSNGSI
jgi:hypothetical protein